METTASADPKAGLAADREDILAPVGNAERHLRNIHEQHAQPCLGHLDGAGQFKHPAHREGRTAAKGQYIRSRAEAHVHIAQRRGNRFIDRCSQFVRADRKATTQAQSVQTDQLDVTAGRQSIFSIPQNQPQVAIFDLQAETIAIAVGGSQKCFDSGDSHQDRRTRLLETKTTLEIDKVGNLQLSTTTDFCHVSRTIELDRHRHIAGDGDRFIHRCAHPVDARGERASQHKTIDAHEGGSAPCDQGVLGWRLGAQRGVGHLSQHQA